MLTQTIATLAGAARATDVETLKNTLANADRREIVQALHPLPGPTQVIAFRLLSKDQALSVFELLDTEHQRTLLASFTDERANEVVDALPPDVRVRLLDELPATVAKRLVSSLSPTERDATAILMGYKRETAGRIMTTEFISLARDMTVDAALDRIRAQAHETETIYTLYVTGPDRRLDGAVSLRELFVADPGARVGVVMSHPAVSVATSTDQERVARLLQDLDLLAVPVVDSENRLVGIVTVDDALDVLEEEATDDLYAQAGLATINRKETSRSEVMVRGHLWSIWKVRLPFLVLTLVGGLVAGLVIEGFEEALESVAAVAVFIPLIMDMGGSVGTQSSTVFARGVALGHIDIRSFWKPFLKEVGVGSSLGAIVGIAGGLVAGVWQGSAPLGLAVGFALVFTMTLSALLGYLVPWVLVKLGTDHAAGSAPIITSIKDVSGLLIYFGFVTLFLSHLL